MTTLPQTTGIRLPRPMGNGYAITTPASAQPHAAQSQTGLTPADIWRVIRANAWLIILSLIASAILGYGANWLLRKYAARYTTTGMIAVEPPRIYDPTQKQFQNISDYTSLQVEQRTQTQILTSQSHISSVLSDVNASLRNTAWFKEFTLNGRPDIPRAKAELADRFSATPIPDSKLITVSMSCASAKDAKIIVTNLVEDHLRAEGARNFTRVNDRLRLLNSISDKQQRKMRELAEKQNARMAQLQIGAVGSPGRYTATDLELQSLIGEQIKQQSFAASAQADYANIEQQIQNGIEPSMVEAMVESQQLVIGYRDRIVSYDAQIEGALNSGKDSRSIKEMETIRDFFKRELDDVIAQKTIIARGQVVSSAQSAAKSSQDALETLNKRIETLKGQLGDMAVVMSEYLTAADQITSITMANKEITDQIDNVQSAATVTSVYWVAQPEEPDSPSFPKLGITLSAAIMLGLMFSLGIAFARELLDTSVRSPRDIARIGQMNLLGMLPHEDDDVQSAGVPLPLVIYQAPTSLMAEHYRQVRTRLQHAASLDTTRTILVTSPGPGDGKTTVACNLAAGLALNGRRILLVDANFRRPELNRVFGVANDSGFSNVLNAIDQFDASVKATSVPNLDVLTTGPKPANPTEQLESQLFVDFVERALEEYDHVIFDTGPLLLVSETAALAPRVDGVVTVVKARSNSRGLLQRLRDTLRQLKAEHLGVVLNGVRSQGGGYYGRNIRSYYEYGATANA